MNRPRYVLALAAAALMTAASLAGCSPSSPPYAETATEYTAGDLDTLFERAASSNAEGQPVSNSEKLRHRALVELRQQGAGAASAADLITETFPVNTRGVPIYVERASFEGVGALLVLEATGPQDGSLEDVRLWVLDDSGEVLYSEVR